jgi:hypothetical protein
VYVSLSSLKSVPLKWTVADTYMVRIGPAWKNQCKVTIGRLGKKKKKKPKCQTKITAFGISKNPVGYRGLVLQNIFISF